MQVTAITAENGELHPISFQLGEREYLVQEVVDIWPGYGANYYKCLADDGKLYILSHKNGAGWELAAFRDPARSS